VSEARGQLRAVDSAAPRPPQGLSKPTVAWWRSIVDEWVLEAHHMRLLEQACRAWDRCEEARKRVEEDGMMIDSGRYGLKQHPLLAV
jgi:phage terminase small subunit